MGTRKEKETIASYTYSDRSSDGVIRKSRFTIDGERCVVCVLITARIYCRTIPS